MIKITMTLFYALLILGSCRQPELSAEEKFNKIKIGMPLPEALAVFGLKDTIGKSYTQEYEIANEAGEDSLIATGKTLKVLFIAFDSNYTFVVTNDQIMKKIDNTFMNKKFGSKL